MGYLKDVETAALPYKMAIKSPIRFPVPMIPLTGPKSFSASLKRQDNLKDVYSRVKTPKGLHSSAKYLTVPEQNKVLQILMNLPYDQRNEYLDSITAFFEKNKGKNIEVKTKNPPELYEAFNQWILADDHFLQPKQKAGAAKRLMKLDIPIDLRKVPANDIYRAIILPAATQNVKSLKLDGSMPLSSWTTSKAFAKKHAETITNNGGYIIVKKSVKAKSVFAYVPAVAKLAKKDYVDADNLAGIEWAPQEREVIIINNSYYLTVTQKEIVARG